MSLEETIALAVKQAVREAVAPLTEELQRLRASQEEEGVTLDDAARRLKVSRRTVQRWIKSGDLPGVKVGNAIRVKLSDVLRLAA